jgi:hypothetical protein
MIITEVSGKVFGFDKVKDAVNGAGKRKHKWKDYCRGDG